MNDLQDQVTTLRLELARERDRADAFRHAFNVEVLKVMRVAVIQSTIDADNEVARLKAEVERLRKAGDDMAFHYQELVRIEWGQMTSHIPPSVIRWNAAKDGKQP